MKVESLGLKKKSDLNIKKGKGLALSQSWQSLSGSSSPSECWHKCAFICFQHDPLKAHTAYQPSALSLSLSHTHIHKHKWNILPFGVLRGLGCDLVANKGTTKRRLLLFWCTSHPLNLSDGLFELVEANQTQRVILLPFHSLVPPPGHTLVSLPALTVPGQKAGLFYSRVADTPMCMCDCVYSQENSDSRCLKKKKSELNLSGALQGHSFRCMKMKVNCYSWK